MLPGDITHPTQNQVRLHDWEYAATLTCALTILRWTCVTPGSQPVRPPILEPTSPAPALASCSGPGQNAASGASEDDGD